MSKTFKVTIPSDIVPIIESCTIELDNSENSVIQQWGVCVAGYSKIKITANAKGAYGSTIEKFNIICPGGLDIQSNGSLNWTSGIITTSGLKMATVFAIDSRNRECPSSSVTFNAISYSPPSISNFSVARSPTNASQIVAKANWKYYSIEGKNSASATLYYKKLKDTNWTTYGRILQNTDNYLDAVFDEYTSYDFRLIVTDRLSSSEPKEAFISTIEVLVDFRAGGKGLAIGKISENDELEVALDARFSKEIYIGDMTLAEYIRAIVNGS